MKFGELKSIAHNIAHSLGSGAGIIIGYHETDIYDEAARSASNYVEVDFLKGTISGAEVSHQLARAIPRYAHAFRDLCKRHGTTAGAFAELTVRYGSDIHGRRFFVTVADRAGRRVVDEFHGVPGKRASTLDGLGRRRKKPSLNLSV